MQRAYPKGLVPSFDVVTTPYDTTSRASGHNRDGLQDLVHHIRKHAMRKGKPVPSESKVLERIDAHAAKMGFDPETGRGLLGSLWSGIKGGLKNAGSQIWNKVKEDPMGTLQTVVNLFKDAGEVAAV